jgi:hypothetical protein
MPQGTATVDPPKRGAGSIGRRLARRVRRAAHRMLCLVPLYRRRAELQEPPRALPRKAASTAKAANAAASVPTARLVKLSDKDAVHRILGDIRTRGLHATAGKVQLVHLDSVRRKFGARWPAVAARAMDLAERVVRELLDEEDIFTRYENFAFVIVFSMIDDAVAQSRAAAISARIHDLLMTDRELAEVFDVKAATARVDDLARGAGELTPGALGAGLDAETGGRETAPVRGASALLGKLALGYQPVYTVAAKQIDISIALPERTTPDGAVLFGESAYPEGFPYVLTDELDKLLTEHVINDLLLPVNAGKRRIIATVVSYHSLLKSARLVYRLGQLPDATRERFGVEIIGLPGDASPDALAGVVRKLGNVTGHITLRAGLFDAGFGRFAELGFRSIGCDLSHPDVAALPPGKRDAAIAGFVDEVKAAGACAHFYGVATAGAIKTAIGAGAHYLSGEAIGPCTPKPQPVRPAEF